MTSRFTTLRTLSAITAFFFLIFTQNYVFCQPTIDGDMSDTDYTIVGTFNSGNDSFGSANNIGVIKSYSDNTNIYIGITGEVNESNNIILFLNFSGYGGRGAGNELDPNNGPDGTTGVFNKSANPGTDNVRMDMDVDFALAFNKGSSSNFFVDAARYGSSDLITDGNIGSTGNQTGGAAFLNAGSVFGGIGNMSVAYDGNFAGNSDKGVEFVIPFTAFAGVDNTQTLQLFAIISNANGELSNECIPGNPGSGNLAANFNFSTVAGQDFFTTPFILPVELSRFIVTPSAQHINLSWQTKTEINNHYFELERSTDAKQWTKITRVEGKGTTNIEQHYQYTDHHPAQGANYYRLQQVDFDGSRHFSEVISVAFEGKTGTAALYPNPMREEVTLNWFFETDEGAWLRIVSENGQLLQQVRIAQPEGRQVIDIQNWAVGWYIFNITTDNGTTVLTEKLLKQ